MPITSRPYQNYYCSICEREQTWPRMQAIDSPRKCKSCKIYICPTCYKEYVKKDICPKCSGKLYMPSF